MAPPQVVGALTVLWIATFFLGVAVATRWDEVQARPRFGLVSSSATSDVFQTADLNLLGRLTPVALAFAVVATTWTARGAIAGRSTRSPAGIWCMSAGVGAGVLVVGLAAASLGSLGTELAISDTGVVITDRYLLGRSSSRPMSLEDAVRIDDVEDTLGEEDVEAVVSVVDGHGDARRVSSGDRSGQQAIASSLVARTNLEIRCVRLRGDAGDGGKVHGCDF